MSVSGTTLPMRKKISHSFFPLLIKSDCRFFQGEKPCRYRCLCEGCAHYAPMGRRILLIKLGAMGDVLRTTPLLAALKKKYPCSFITWLTRQESRPLLEGNPLIDRILVHDFESRLRLEVETFDLLINADKDPSVAALTMVVKARTKRGYGLGHYGNLIALNHNAAYSFALGISDQLKFKDNQKTYQETLCELAGLPYTRQEYLFCLPAQDAAYARQYLARHHIRRGQRVVGLNTGCGPVFPQKKWTIEGYRGLVKKIHRILKAHVVLLGGPHEQQRNRQIRVRLGIPVVDTGSDNCISRFAGFIECCDLVVTGDTIALHLAIALKKPVVALFGPTCAQEIDLYGRGTTIVTPASCAPCYRNSCARHPSCMEMISVDEVFQAVRGNLKHYPETK